MNDGRKNIRARIVEILTDAADDLGVPSANIFSNRSQEILANIKFPCIVVNTTGDEEVRDIPVQSPFREYELGLSLEIACAVSAAGAIEDKLDDLQDAILNEILKHEMDQDNPDSTPQWGDLLYRRSTQQLHEDNNKTIAIGVLVFDVIYQAEAAQKETSILEGIDTTYDVGTQYREPGSEPNPADLVGDNVDLHEPEEDEDEEP